VLDLIRAIRNARAEAGIEPGAWLPATVTAPRGAIADLDALSIQIERLARVRPLEIRPATTPGAKAAGGAGGLAVVVGRLEASLAPSTSESAGVGRDRDRLQKELASAEQHLAAVRTRLADSAFTSRAPEAIVAGARTSEAELAAQVSSLRERLDR
jgi:valyl-tRNA synthetase